jgi:hypothetical protein
MFLAGASQAQAAVHTREQLTALMAAGPTALDALTPHGKRSFLESLRPRCRRSAAMRTCSRG